MENLTRILLLACFAVLSEGTDLTGHVFTFPELTDVDHVSATPLQQRHLSQVSVCLRFASNQTDHFPCFFFLGSHPSLNFELCRTPLKMLQLIVAMSNADFRGLPEKLNEWNSLCVVWDGVAAQAFMNGQASERRQVSSVHWKLLKPDHVIRLGQGGTSVSGQFGKYNAFTGHITDVHVWDHAISTCAVQRFMKEKYIQPGNHLNWGNITFQAHGNARLEKDPLFSDDMMC